MYAMDLSGTTKGKLGAMTLWIMIFRRLGLFAIVLLFSVIMWFASISAPPQFGAVLLGFVPYLFLISLVLLMGAFLVGYAAYSHYGIVIGEGDVRITRGIVTEEEIGIPFRRIKEVAIKRDPFDQMIGSSTVIVTVLGEAEDMAKEHSIIILPSLARSKAAEIQSALLKYANVEKVQNVAG